MFTENFASVTDSPTMGVAEAAQILGVSPRHIRNSFHRGELSGAQVGRCIRISRHAVYSLVGFSDAGEVAANAGVRA